MSDRLSVRSPRYHPLDESPDLSPQTPRRGLPYFLKHNTTIVLASAAGLANVIAVIWFTIWLSKQIPRCPDWSVNCKVSYHVALLTRNLGTAQGIVTAVYSIGLAALAFAAHAFSESALWPLLNRRHLTIKQIEVYIEASRGSIPSSPWALFAARNFDSALVLVSTILITLAPLSAAPILGQVYNRRDVAFEVQSNATPGGGIGPRFRQTYPPSSFRESSGAFFASWVHNYSVEPMPDYREWWIDRLTLSERGNFTVQAPRFQQNITCRGWKAEPSGFDSDKQLFTFDTNMVEADERSGRTKDNSNDQAARVQEIPKLAVWVHNYTFASTDVTISTLVFAALNGNIEGGVTTSNISSERITNITSVACDIAMELTEGTLIVGNVRAEGGIGDEQPNPMTTWRDRTLSKIVYYFMK